MYVLVVICPHLVIPKVMFQSSMCLKDRTGKYSCSESEVYGSLLTTKPQLTLKSIRQSSFGIWEQTETESSAQNTFRNLKIQIWSKLMFVTDTTTVGEQKKNRCTKSKWMQGLICLCKNKLPAQNLDFMDVYFVNLLFSAAVFTDSSESKTSYLLENATPTSKVKSRMLISHKYFIRTEKIFHH